MELHIVIDNLPAPGNAPEQGNAGEKGNQELPLKCEHGLSIHFQLEGKNYLVDTGASGKFLENLPLMPGLENLSAEEIDAVIISHGHNDHTGGLRKFFECNTTAPVYLHSTVRGNYFYSCRPKNGVREARNIGMEQALFIDYGHRFVEFDGPLQLSEKIILLPANCPASPSGPKAIHPTPMGNEFLYKNDFPDNFSHETITLVEFAPSRYAVISPCTHNGILNVLARCEEWLQSEARKRLSGREYELAYFVGGLHYVDYLGMGQGEKEAAQILGTANILKEKYPALKIFSGHCTCSRASELLGNVLGENYEVFRTGTVISCI